MDLDVTIDHQISELQEFLNLIPKLGPLNPPDLGNQMEIR